MNTPWQFITVIFSIGIICTALGAVIGGLVGFFIGKHIKRIAVLLIPDLRPKQIESLCELNVKPDEV